MGRSGVYQEKTEKKQELSPIATRISDMNMVTFLFVECAIIIIFSVRLISLFGGQEIINARSGCLRG